MKFKGIEMKLIMLAYAEGANFEEILEKFYLPKEDLSKLRTAVHTYIHRNKYYEIGNKHLKNISLQTLYRHKTEDQMTDRQLASLYDISIREVDLILVQYCKENKLPLNDTTKHKFINLPIEQIIEERNNGATLSSLAQKYDISINVLKSHLKEELGHEGYEDLKRVSNEQLYKQVDQIIKCYSDGLTSEEIAEKFGVTKKIIEKILKWKYNKYDKEVPQVLSKEKIETYKQKGYTKEEILTMCRERGYLLSREFLNKIYDAEINIDDNNDER